MSYPTRSRAPLALCSILLALGCDPEPSGRTPGPSADPAANDEAFEEAFEALSNNYGDGKADIFGDLGIDKCQLLEPLVSNFDQFVRSGFVVGAETQGTLGAVAVVSGYDIVWDVYHHQLTVSKYQSGGVTSGVGYGGSASVYVGGAVNFQSGVSDWNGYFVTAGAEVNATEIILPFLAALPIEIEASITPSVFVSAADRDGNGVPEVIFPDGVYGFSIAAGVGAGLELDLPLPAIPDISVTEGLWEPDEDKIRWVFDKLDGARQLGFIDLMDVRLVDADSGQDCLEINPDWPYEDAAYEGLHPSCVVEFGNPGDSNIKRSISTSLSICELSGDCAIPVAWPFATMALAIGALRDAGEDIRAECGLEPETAMP